MTRVQFVFLVASLWRRPNIFRLNLSLLFLCKSLVRLFGEDTFSWLTFSSNIPIYPIIFWGEIITLLLYTWEIWSGRYDVK